MALRFSALLVCTTLALGCGPTVMLDPGDSGGTAGSEDTTAAGDSPGPVTSTGTPPPATTVGGDSTSASDESTGNGDNVFLPDPTGGPEAFECDTFEQDCPEGEKCMPWANDGGSSWNATRCSPVALDPGQTDDPCTVEGSGVSGIDSCDVGLMCWDVNPKTNEGVCWALCTGSPKLPTCEADNATCQIASDGALALCVPRCNPLTQDCREGQGCYPINDSFQCAPVGGRPPAGPGQSCEYINSCEAGTACLPGEAVPGCEELFGCCTEFCDLGSKLGDAQCSGMDLGQQCQPWYEPGTAPPGYENVGICAGPDAWPSAGH